MHNMWRKLMNSWGHNEILISFVAGAVMTAVLFLHNLEEHKKDANACQEYVDEKWQWRQAD